jgi:hypothetical protein
VVDELRATFTADLERCRRIHLDTWRRRGPWRKMKEQFASLLEDQI